jgi:putative transposase
MADSRYKTSASCVYSLKYHLVWCPKCRKKELVGGIETRLRELLYEKADNMGVQIEALEIMPDHVHLFISADPTEASQRLADQFKGYTSRILRQQFASLESRLPTLWSRSYYVGSVGYVSEDSVKKYIANQKTRP